MIQQTSLLAYAELIKENELGRRQKEVYEAIKRLGSPTNSEISFWLNRKINTITPRVHELRKAGFVIEAGKRECKVTKYNVLTWKAR